MASVEGWRSHCSGAMYGGEPARGSGEPMAAEGNISGLASPKSRMTTRPWGVMRTLEGLRSRWTSPEAWSARRPWASSRNTRRRRSASTVREGVAGATGAWEPVVVASRLVAVASSGDELLEPVFCLAVAERGPEAAGRDIP